MQSPPAAGDRHGCCRQPIRLRAGGSRGGKRLRVSMGKQRREGGGGLKSRLKKGLKKGIIGLVGAAVIIVISYLVADDTILNMPHYTGGGNVPRTLKLVDTGMFTAYILLGLAVLAILWSSISRVFK